MQFRLSLALAVALISCFSAHGQNASSLRNPAEARRAAAEAAYALSIPDYQQARRAWESAFEAGDGDAANSLGEMYLSGRGLPQSVDEAVRWFRLGGKRGSAEAAKRMAAFSASGLHVPKDAQQQLFWTRAAANYGDPEAQFNLGKLYASGIGLPPHQIEACRWYRIAAASGHVIAKAGASHCDRILSESDAKTAEKRAVAWRPRRFIDGPANALRMEANRLVQSGIQDRKTADELAFELRDAGFNETVVSAAIAALGKASR